MSRSSAERRAMIRIIVMSHSDLLGSGKYAGTIEIPRKQRIDWGPN